MGAPPPVDAVAAALDAAGVYLNAGIGVSIQGTYSLRTLYYFNNGTPDGYHTVTVDPSPGVHSFTFTEDVMVLMTAFADYLYGGDLHLAFGQSLYGDIGSYDFPTGLNWDPTFDGGRTGPLGIWDIGEVTYTGYYTSGTAPLPPTVLLLGSGLLGLVGLRRFRKG
jgi:hypothetical protein